MPLTDQEILRFLADGRDHRTGEALPEDHILNQAAVVRALNRLLRAKQSRLPRRQGHPWLQSEDDELSASFRGKATIEELAKLHCRTPGAIEARLSKLRLIF